MSVEEKKPQTRFIWTGSLDPNGPATMALDVAGLRFDFIIAKKPPAAKETGTPNPEAPTMYWIHARVNGYPWEHGTLSISYPSVRTAVRACEDVLTKILSTFPKTAPAVALQEGT